MHQTVTAEDQIDGGQAITVLAGVHPGCFELFGTDRVRSLKDLKGKRIAVIGLGSSPHIFLSSMLAHVGLEAAPGLSRGFKAVHEQHRSSAYPSSGMAAFGYRFRRAD